MHFRASHPLRAAALAALLLPLHACVCDDASDASTTGASDSAGTGTTGTTGTAGTTGTTSAASDPTASTADSATATSDPTATSGETTGDTTGDTGATTGATTGPGVLPGETGLDAFCRRYVECGGSYYPDQQACIDASLDYWGSCPSRRQALDDFGACMSDMECSDWSPDAYNPGSTPCAEHWAKLGDSQPCD